LGNKHSHFILTCIVWWSICANVNVCVLKSSIWLSLSLLRAKHVIHIMPYLHISCKFWSLCSFLDCLFGLKRSSRPFKHVLSDAYHSHYKMLQLIPLAHLHNFMHILWILAYVDYLHINCFPFFLYRTCDN